MFIVKVFRIFFKRGDFVVFGNDKESKEIGAVSKRPPLPGLPNLVVNVGECPTLAREVSRIRVKRANISKFFMYVLEDEENG